MTQHTTTTMGTASTAPAEYTVRRATSAADLAGARTVALHAVEVDLGYGYQPGWHWDLDRLVETYLDNPRQAMFVAAAPNNTVVATAAVRVGGPNCPPHPVELAQRYADRQTVAQLLRVATLPEHRRAGLARRLVAACQEFVRADGGYRVIYLHTNTVVPSAEPFWRSLPVVEIRDDRSHQSDPQFQTIHFELPLAATISRES
ncbi:GNAT family N-acetyltransferase [Kribbella sp. NPDC050820]|uniref:GNAT family N-acetyltransferase n=1 Tax=Kribbella sp. NPDC050820 TaxID=3155408 RepID=UPI0033D2FE89